MFIHITGTGSYLPERVVTNSELATKLDTSDEWIRSHTGISSRHIAADDQSTSTIAVNAARVALDAAGLKPEQIGMIVLATSTPDYHSFPSTACLVQHALGAKNAGAFDIQAACTGFIYALEVARGLMMVNPQPTLVIGADLMSRIVDWSDRNSCILFGDAAGAVVLEASNVPGGIWHSILKADGSGSQLLYREGGSRQLAEGPWMKQNTLEMQGRQVFNFAVKIFDEVLTGLLNHVGYTFDDLACVIPHQANARIIEAVARRMSVPLGKFFMNMETTGNTSAASIPVALDEMVRKGLIKDDDLVAMVGFGAGLTYGGLLMRWRGKAGKPKANAPQQLADVSENA